MTESIKRVLITGIVGSTGSYLADYIINNYPKTEIHGIKREINSSQKNLERIIDKVQVHLCDLRELNSTVSLIKKTRPEIVFHLASYVNMKESFKIPNFVAENNVIGTVNLFEAIRLSKINPKIFLASSSKVYGLGKDDKTPMRENLPFFSADPYSASKISQESFAQAYFLSFGLQIVTSRVFGYINPRREDLFATSWAKQIVEIENGEKKELKHGNLNPIRTFMDIRDIVETVWIIATTGKPGEAYNVGSEDSISIGDVLSIMKQKAKIKIQTRKDPSLIRPTDIIYHVPDINKFKSLSDWRPKYSLEESIAYLLNYCRKNV